MCKILYIYTDGACRGNPGPGAAVALLTENGKIVRRLKVFREKTTNNVMELGAIWMALKETSKDDIINFYCDSLLAIELSTGKKKTKLPHLKNIVDQIHVMLKGRKVSFHHVRGHNGNYFNEKADQYANEVLDAALNKKEA